MFSILCTGFKEKVLINVVIMILVSCCVSYDDTVLGCDGMSLDDWSAVLRIIILRTVHAEYENTTFLCKMESIGTVSYPRRTDFSTTWL